MGASGDAFKYGDEALNLDDDFFKLDDDLFELDDDVLKLSDDTAGGTRTCHKPLFIVLTFE